MKQVTSTHIQAQSGIKILSNQSTTIKIRSTSMELLIGGAYAEHQYGHTALRINVDLAEFVYDYGRYGLYMGPVGQGVLKIWRSFEKYIKSENDLMRITTGYVYSISHEKANEIINNFNEKIKGRDLKKRNGSFDSYVINSYNALGPNCTTISVDAARIAMPEIDKDWRLYRQGRGLNSTEKKMVDLKGWPSYVFMPADLQEMLENSNAKYVEKKIYKNEN